MEIRRLSTDSIEEIKFVIKDTFSREPRNDDWTDENKFHAYILDLIGNLFYSFASFLSNLLTYGPFS